MVNICDDCMTAAYDEGGPHLSADEQTTLCVGMGADIVDHRCKQFDGGERCDCACYGGPSMKHNQT